MKPSKTKNSSKGSNPLVIPSFICGEWAHGAGDGTPIHHAVTGKHIFSATTEGFDFQSILAWSGKHGGPALRQLTFHERAARLKLLAQFLLDRKEVFYTLSHYTGATRHDSWIDVEGGISTLFSYASKARKELPNETFHLEGSVEQLSKENSFVGQHLCLPLEGVAVHINAFNFPCWGMLEKLAPTIIAGVPAIIKPATATCYLTQKMVEAIIESDILPLGSLQLVCGSIGDTLNHLTCQDVVTFTGSKATGSKLKVHPRITDNAVRFNLEADSLNCSILGERASPGTQEFKLFIKEVARELTVKAGQKCTAIRRALIPQEFQSEFKTALEAELLRYPQGNPELTEVKMGPLVSVEQVRDVSQNVAQLRTECEVMLGGDGSLSLIDADAKKGNFFPKTVLLCADPNRAKLVHSIEAFGPVCTVIPYKNLEQAIDIARKGGGSLCASIFSADDEEAKALALGLGPFHGRILIADQSCAKESTGHGSPLPHLVHGGPGRAGGGEELGGIRSILHYMQRTAFQGSPSRIAHLSNKWVPGARIIGDKVHPFRKYFGQLSVGESWLTHRRTITEADVVNFAALSGDHFYAHVDETAAKESIFGARVAHGYLVLAVAAGLFVDPAPGPVLANYGLDGLRFTKPVYIGDTLQVRLTCKQKTPKSGFEEGIVYWHVEVFNQIPETVAVYTILTLVSTEAK